MKPLSRLVAGLALLGCIRQVAAAPPSADCPSTLHVVQRTGIDSVDGWTSFDSNDDHPFENVSFSAGPPDQKATLAPTSEQRKGTLNIATWRLPPSETAYWVTCEYAGTKAVLAKPLDKVIHSCRVEYDGRFSRPVARRWTCQPREAGGAGR